MAMFGRNFDPSKVKGERELSRLEEVMIIVKRKAIFWDRTSMSMIFGVLALAGLVLMWQGIQSLSSGQFDFLFIPDRGPSVTGWSFTLMCIALTGYGINFTLPFIFFWFVNDKRNIIINLTFFGLNSVIFGYAFLVHAITTYRPAFS